MEKVLYIEGMSCEHCVSHVHKALTELAGVENAAIDLGSKSAKVSLSADVSDETFREAIDDAGYELVNVE